jgi:serine/threonine protein kinase
VQHTQQALLQQQLHHHQQHHHLQQQQQMVQQPPHIQQGRSMETRMEQQQQSQRQQRPTQDAEPMYSNAALRPPPHGVSSTVSRGVVAASTAASTTTDDARRRRAAMAAELLRTFFTPTLGSCRYVAERFLGEGAYGVVVSARDTVTGDLVAVKRIRKCLNNHPMFTRTLRELKFLRLLSPHKNIINVRDVLLPGEFEKFNDTFVVFEKMPTDLKKVLESTTEITPDHVKYFMFQLLCGIHYMHSANVFHRDLKPSNILINEKCELRICDFGLARASYESGPDTTRFWTDYVATRWYRAPELIMEDHSTYSTAIDMWSVGCIFAEIISSGKVLFQGSSARHMFELITDVLGSPPRHVVEKLRNQSARRVLNEFLHPRREPRPLHQMFPTTDPQAIDLLARLLVLDQDERISALDALHLPYFSQYWHLGFGVEADPLPASEFVFERATLSHEQMRLEFLKEILHYHPNESISVLENYNYGKNVLMPSAVHNFGQQCVQVCDGGGRIRGSTLQETVLNELTGRPLSTTGQGGYHVTPRQHVTMTETELGLFNKH